MIALIVLNDSKSPKNAYTHGARNSDVPPPTFDGPMDMVNLERGLGLGAYRPSYWGSRTGICVKLPGLECFCGFLEGLKRERGGVHLRSERHVKTKNHGSQIFSIVKNV